MQSIYHLVLKYPQNNNTVKSQEDIVNNDLRNNLTVGNKWSLADTQRDDIKSFLELSLIVKWYNLKEKPKKQNESSYMV